MSTERILVPKDGQGNVELDDAEDYYIATYDVMQYRSWDDGAGRMYQNALETIWDAEEQGRQ